MSPWHEDYFRLIIFKKQKAEKEIFTFLLTVYKNLDRGSDTGRKAITRDHYKEYGLPVVGGTWQSLKIKVLSVSHCVWKTFIYQIFVDYHEKCHSTL